MENIREFDIILFLIPKPSPTNSSKYKEGDYLAEEGESSTQSQGITLHQQYQQYFEDSSWPELVTFPDFFWDSIPIPGKLS